MIFPNNDDWSPETIQMNLLYGVNIFTAEQLASSTSASAATTARHHGTRAAPRHGSHAARHHQAPSHYKLRQVQWRNLEL